MANHKSSKKRARQTITRTARNRSQNSSVKTVIKEIRTAIEAKNKEEATTLLPKAQKLIARLAKTGYIKANTAARRTSRLATQVTRL